jgi:hypothetical protein
MMKVLLLGIVTTLAALAQPKITTPELLPDCGRWAFGSAPGGSRPPVNITCSNIDAKLAEQIGQLVAASRRDAKALKIITDKMGSLLIELQNQPTTIGVISVIQQGGWTAGEVAASGGLPPVTLSFSQMSANQKQTGRDGVESYVTAVRLSLTGMAPILQITVSAASLTRISVFPENGGAATGSLRPAVNGSGGQSIQAASGQYVLKLESSAPEHFQIEYSCQGAGCFPEAGKN